MLEKSVSWFYFLLFLHDEVFGLVSSVISESSKWKLLMICLRRIIDAMES